MKSSLFIFTFLFLLVSCGVDQLNKKTTVSALSNSTNNSTMSCLCTSDYAPVCDKASGKDYENACLAKCFGSSSYVSGHCTCDNNRTVCGSDGKDYGECDAVNSGISITKYIPCGSVGL